MRSTGMALQNLGRGLRSKLAEYLYALGFVFTVFRKAPSFFRRGRAAFKIFVMQVLFTGVEALSVAAVMAVAIGAAIIIVGSSILPNFGQSNLMYPILIAIITRELGPLLTAFVIIARSGTAIATELGSMVVSHEIEAYVSFGIDPLAFLAVPRMLGVTVAIIILNIYFNVFGLLGSFLVVQFVKPIPVSQYFIPLFSSLGAGDLGISILKSLVFGIIVSMVSIYQGFSVQRASTEIPVAGIRAVGQSFVLCILADVVLSLIYYVS